MNAYQGLAGAYDSLTGDVAYEKRADYLEKLFARSRIPVHTVLDLACGTGTMTWLLTGRGYEMIGADASEEMLAAAMMKSGSVEGIAPIFVIALSGGNSRTIARQSAYQLNPSAPSFLSMAAGGVSIF